MKKLIYSFIALSFSFGAIAQESVSVEEVTTLEQTETTDEAENAEVDDLGFSFSGTADVYFRYNLDVDDQGVAPPTSFANLPGFSLGMANLIASQDWQKAGAKVDLVFGPRGEDATFLSEILRPNGNSSIVNQLYAYYNFSDKVSATIGNFNTFLGYEVISPAGDFNYSTSYMFSYGPFSHTGVKVDAQLSDEFSIMAGVFNPTDDTEYNPINEYTGGFQLGYSGGKATIYLNTLAGKDYFQEDLTAGFDVSDKLYLGVNSTVALDNFWGVAGYAHYGITDATSIGTRIEYFADNGLGLLGTDENVLDLTFSGNLAAGGLTIIPEFRVDLYSDNFINDTSGPQDKLASFLVAAVYNFER